MCKGENKMVKEDRRIKTNEVKLIKGLIGKKLVKAEGAIASPPNVAWNTIRLHANNNYSLDINCYLEKVKINEVSFKYSLKEVEL